MVQELPADVLESDDELFTIEEVSTVKHARKGQFFVPLRFSHEQGSSVVDCQLDTGATCNVMSMIDVCAILHTQNPLYKQKPCS